MSDFFLHDVSLVPTNVTALVMGLLLAFLTGQILAWVYMWTHTGLSYSRTFVNSLVVIPMVVSLVMTVLSNNLVTAFGLMAVFAIVRFRNILRDTLDTTYLLAVIVLGMAAGTMKFATALVGCLVIAGILYYLYLTGFGRRLRYDLVVNLHWGRPLSELDELRSCLDRHTMNPMMASQRTHEGYQGTDLSYRLRMRDPDRMEELLTDLRELPGVSRVTGLKAEEESEV
ncbi:MAG: hypothetical protein RI897_2327 [Verrucomicrobiota bacterium]|jgi:hypothetical protein